MTDVATCLLFAREAEEAARFYASLLPGSEITRVLRAPSDTPAAPRGEVLAVTFTLGGRPFTALNAGQAFAFTPATSVLLVCEDQAEVDRLWAGLTADGGRESCCGWCVDRYGLHWQVAPRRLDELLSDPDLGRASRAFQAMSAMRRIDVAALERAADDAGPLPQAA